jgi:hypothetical protein
MPTRSYSLRKRVASPGSSSDEEGQSISARPKKPLPPRKPTRGKQADPLSFLLREKIAAERRGGDAGALERAEAALSRGSSVDPLADEEAARVIAARGIRAGLSSSPDPGTPEPPAVADGEVIDHEERERLLGSATGTVVGAIIDDDGVGRTDSDSVGVRLWADRDVFDEETLDTPAFPTLSLPGGGTNPLLECLSEAASSGGKSTDTFK